MKKYSGENGWLRSSCCYDLERMRVDFFSSGCSGGVPSEVCFSSVIGFASSGAFFSSVVVFSVSISLVMSSIGFGGGVVAIVQPIQAPIASIAMNATNTGIATSVNDKAQ